MIAVAISEIAGWLKNESGTTISIMIILIGLAGSFSFLRPEVCLELLTAVILWVAIKAGKENWSEFALQDWVKRTELSLRTVILGKVTAALAICLIHLLFVFPVLVIMLILWGFSWMQLVNALLMILTAALIGAGLGLWGSCPGKSDQDVLTGISVGIWIVATALIPLLRPLNPFYFIWNLLISDVSPLTAVVYLINLGLAAGSFLMTEYFFRRGARYA